jgi:polyphosphate glucokinase
VSTGAGGRTSGASSEARAPAGAEPTEARRLNAFRQAVLHDAQSFEGGVVTELDKAPGQAAASVLTVDVGGSHVKLLVNGASERRRFVSGSDTTPDEVVEGVVERTLDWEFGFVSVGVPAPVLANRVVHEPPNLGVGWVGFDFEAAFGRPTKVLNDAAMQALGSYAGGRMLFLGLGTGLGSAMVVDGSVDPMELAHLPYREHTYEDYVGERGRKRLGKKRWREAVLDVVERLSAALESEYVVLGGGNAKRVGALPDNVRLGHNEAAFLGGFRLWAPAGTDA